MPSNKQSSSAGQRGSVGRESERVIRSSAGGGASSRSGAGMSSGGSLPGGSGTATSESDENYALISVIYHALQGADTSVRYIDDARRSGDTELVTFFEDCQRLDRERAARARQLLAERLVEDLDDEDEDEELDDEEDDEDDDEGV
ncbi:MAG TPA: hypothetical protein VFQ61_17980 [Polyangiaceae bacterium]|nr:hypothetical protein [Polyangiaceae bacterium]